LRFTVADDNGEETVLELSLESDNDTEGSIDLVAREVGNDEPWYLMSFRDGRFVRHSGIDVEGIETERSGRIKEITKD
jgi:hypothetical protein